MHGLCVDCLWELSLMPAKTAAEWYAEYGYYHQNPTNKSIHWICIPAIMTALVGLLWSLPVPWATVAPWLNWAIVIAALSLLFYARLSLGLAIGMAAWLGLTMAVVRGVEVLSPQPVWIPALVLFVVAWIGQFYGHAIEGKKPAFFKDLQFLLIGPAWLLNDAMKRCTRSNNK